MYSLVLCYFKTWLESFLCSPKTVYTGAVIRPKTTQNSYDSTDILLEDVKRLKISMRDRFV